MILCVKAMIPTISEDFQLLCMKCKMGIGGRGARAIPEFPGSYTKCIRRWEKLLVTKAKRGEKSMPAADSYFLWAICR